MKKWFLVITLIALAIACIGFWTIGSFFIGLLMTCGCAVLIVLTVYLLKDYKRARWIFVILLLIASLVFAYKGLIEIKSNISKLMTQDNSKKYNVVIDFEEEKNKENNVDLKEVEVEDAKEIKREKNETVKTVTEIVEKRVEVPVEKKVTEYVEVPVEVEKKVTEYVEVPVVEYIEVPIESSTESSLDQSYNTEENVKNDNVEELPQKETYTGDPTMTPSGKEIYVGDITMNGSGNIYTGDPTGSYNNSYSVKISGPKTVTQGKSYTYTVTGVSSVSENKLHLPENVTAKKVGANKFKLYFEKGCVGSYHIEYGSSKLSIEVVA